MKKTILLLALFMLAALVSAADVNLVSYYNSTIESHACAPANPLCAYNNSVKIPSDFSGTCGLLGAVKILGLSDPTDAHADAMTLSPANFTGNNICMSANTFAGGYCYFTWSDSCDASSGYSCLFGLSDIGNAHLSTCNTFSPEYKFCCKFPNVQLNCPQINLTVSKSDYNVGEMVHFDYNCPLSTVPIDTNIIVDANNFFRTSADQCGQTTKSFEINSSQLDMGTFNPKAFTAQLFTKDGACKSGRVNFNVTIPGPSGVITPVERCKIKSISADPLKLDSNTLVDVNIGVKYDCYNDGVTEAISIFDPNGNVLHTNTNVICNTATQTYAKFQISSSSTEGIYRTRIYDNNCMKEAFFAATKSRGTTTSSSNVPDMDLIPVIALLAVVVGIIAVRRVPKRKH
ncbi:Uncharacterised protein [uncultured archaeon]|nr:Uncharacterised protein [uncultured archaeon]